MPIETTVLTGGQAGVSAYWIDRDRYELTDLHLEPDEMRALQVAVAAVRPTQGREALWKLGLDTIDGDAAGDVAVTATVPELPGLPALREASARRRTVDVRLPRQAAAARPVRAAAAHRLLVRRRPRPRARRAADVPRRPHRGRRRRSTTATTFERPAGFDLRTAFPSDPEAARRRRRGRRRGRRARRRRPGRPASSASSAPTGSWPRHADGVDRGRGAVRQRRRRSGRGCSGCSTTPRCSARRTCGPPSSPG